MADPIGSESLKNLAKLNEQLGQLGGRVQVLEGMLSRAQARTTQFAREAESFNAGRATGAAAETAAGGAWASQQGGGVLFQAEQQYRARLGNTMDAEEGRRQRLSSILQRAPAEEAAITDGLSREIQMRAMASQGLQAHGALTTEFISAAARGQVTIQEFGTQIGLTAAKFAGWTAAAAGVYGALAGVNQVVQGAIASTSGVGQLQRFFDVNPDQAARGFRQVSQELNVSVKDVAEAQAQFARLYHTEADSLTAARVAITATKLDNLSAADSYRYITAAAQGFKLQAQELPNLLAMLNSEQNKLGARVSDTVPSFAKSAGAMKNAGANATELVAIIATLQRATGQGTAVGTALQRFAGRQLQMPSARQVMQQFGVDPTQSATNVLIQSVARAQTLNAQQRQQLANALGGTMYGPRIFTPLLNQPQLLQQALGAAGDKGNLALLKREIGDVVHTSQEGIHGIGNALGRLGSNLAQSGLLNIGGILITGLNGVLNEANRLLDIFNQLPKPVRELSGTMIDIAAVMALMRRFNVGGAFKEGGFLNTVLQPSQNARDNKLVQLGLSNQDKFWQDERERVARQVPVVARQQSAAVTARDEYARQVAAQGGTPTAAQDAELSRLNARAVALTTRRVALLEELDTIDTGMVVSEQQQAAYNALITKGLSARAAASEAGIPYIPGSLNQPAAAGETPIPVGASSEAERAALAGGGMLLGPNGAPIARQQAEEQVKYTQAAEDSLKTVRSNAAEIGGWEASMNRMKLSMSSAREVLGTLPNAFGNLTGSMRGFVNEHPVMAGLTGAMIAMQVGQLLAGVFNSWGGPSGYNNQGTGPNSAAQQAQWAQGNFGLSFGQAYDPEQQRADQNTAQTWMRIQSQVASGQQPWWQYDPHHNRPAVSPGLPGWAPTIPGLGALSSNFTPPSSLANRIPLLGLAKTPSPQDQINAALSRGQVLPGLLPDQIQGQIQSAVQGFQSGHLTLAKANEWLSNAMHDIAVSGQLSGGQTAKLKTEVAQARAVIAAGSSTQVADPSLKQTLNALSSKDLGTWLKGNTDMITAMGDLGQTMGQLRGPGIALGIALKRVRANPSDAQAVTALKDAESALKDEYSQLQSQTDDAVTLARGNQDQIDRAYNSQLSRIQSSGGGRLGAVAYQQALQKKYEADAQAMDAQNTIADAYDKNPIDNAQRDINNIGQEIQMAIVAYGRNSKQVADLIKKQQDGYKQLADAQVALNDANTALAQSQTGSQAGKDLSALQGAEKDYQTMVQSGQYSPTELRQQLAKINDARRAYVDQQRQDAQAVADSASDLKIANLNDPVKIARRQWEQAVNDIKYADPNKPGDVTKAKANAATRYQDYLKATWTAQTDNVDYLLTMGDISTGDAIARLEKLAKREKGNMTAYRATMEKIKQLQNQSQSNSEDELALGNVTMPTAYEVRSRLAQRARLGGNSITQMNAPNISIYVNNAGDVTGVYKALDQTLGTSVMSAARAGNVR